MPPRMPPRLLFNIDLTSNVNAHLVKDNSEMNHGLNGTKNNFTPTINLQIYFLFQVKTLFLLT